MSKANLSKIFGRTVSIQVALSWTLLIAASYVVSEKWLKNNLLTHLILWAIGVWGISSILSWYYMGDNKGRSPGNGPITNLIYHAITETSPDSVAATDLLGNYIFANKQTALLHGYDTTEEFIGKSAFGFFSPSEISKATSYMNMTRSDGVIRNIEFNLMRKDGSTFPAELSAALVKNEFGIPVAFIAVTRDITDRKHIADQLQDMNSQLRLQLTEIEKLQAILREQAIQDPLTGVYNRRYMEEALKQEIARANREKQPFSVVMVDMDNLKTLNDKYGHKIGDAALKSLSKLFKDLTRTEDIVCRYGGDEFLIILHNTGEVSALARLQEWAEKAKEIRILDEDKILQVSFSAGIASYPAYKNIEELIPAADKKLYTMKLERKKLK